MPTLESDVLELLAWKRHNEILPGGAATGTWTPTFVGTGTAGVFTYTTQAGFYSRSNGLVYVTGRVGISAIGTPPVGLMIIGGLPFTSAATYYGPVTFGFISNFNYSASAIELTGTVSPSSAVIELFESFDNGVAVNVPAANFTNAAANIIFSATYQAA
jgi:hypothetical protein